MRPIKAWRYVGVFGPELMVCAASVRVGPFRQSFWAVWDRRAGRLYERTAMGAGAVRLGYGTAAVDDRVLRLDAHSPRNRAWRPPARAARATRGRASRAG